MIKECVEVRRLCDVHTAGKCVVANRMIMFIMGLKGWV